MVSSNCCQVRKNLEIVFASRMVALQSSQAIIIMYLFYSFNYLYKLTRRHRNKHTSGVADLSGLRECNTARSLIMYTLFNYLPSLQGPAFSCGVHSSLSSSFGDLTFLIMTDELVFGYILWHTLWHSRQLHDFCVTVIHSAWQQCMMRDSWQVYHSQHAQLPIARCGPAWLSHWRFKVQIITLITKIKITLR